jgi:hypothetical protein
MREERWTSRGLCSSISRGGVPYRDLGCVPGGKSKMCRKLSKSIMSRAKKTNAEHFPDRDERETRTIMPGCLGIRSLRHNVFRISLLNVLNPNPFILLLRLGCAASPPSPPPPFTNQGHLRRVELRVFPPPPTRGSASRVQIWRRGLALVFVA